MFNSLREISRSCIDGAQGFLSFTATTDGFAFLKGCGDIELYGKDLMKNTTVTPAEKYGNIAYSDRLGLYYATLYGSYNRVSVLNKDFSVNRRICLTPSPREAVNGIGVNRENGNLLISTFFAIYQYDKSGNLIDKIAGVPNCNLGFSCTQSGKTAVWALRARDENQFLAAFSNSGEEIGRIALPDGVFVRSLSCEPCRPTTLYLLATTPDAKNTVITMAPNQSKNHWFWR